MNALSSLFEDPAFRADFERLRDVSLNPARHTASDGFDHSLRVAERAGALAFANECSSEEVALLRDLGFVHDIGKIEGTTSPAKSVELLPRYGLGDPAFVELVRYHDINLPWYIAMRKGEPPSDRAWRKMTSRVDIRLLCLFMVADRVDCPGGWRANAPLVWFLDEATRRGLVASLVLDVADEICAGVALLRQKDGKTEVLMLRVRRDIWELPKGHVEANESKQEAAARELVEETGLRSRPLSLRHFDSLEYHARQDAMHKQVTYFVAFVDEEILFDRPSRTKELRWCGQDDVATLPMPSEELRRLVSRALEMPMDESSGS